ncbi:MAG: AraC family transcriptional regulator [Clostridia bacterium]|nr:AraC family transcriptional regulator [Clostridia bacterium]
MSNCCDTLPYPQKRTSALCPVNCGDEKCAPCHFWGPGVRENFVIHYIISGNGTFYCGPNKYELSAGDAFVIFPYTMVKYIASQETPWHYTWVVFSGDEASGILTDAGITVKNPILHSSRTASFKNLICSMAHETLDDLTNQLHFTSELYELLSIITKKSKYNQKNEIAYFSDAVQYINNNFSEDITVDGIAERLGISRKYLYAVFKNSCGKSPKEYIIDCRIEKACDFLKDKSLSISNVAYSVGYPDQFVFSKMFKQKVGASPSEYRKSLHNL